MSRTILTKSPLRISFAGGGTDIKEYFINGNGAVINATINKYCYCKITDNINGKAVFTSVDKNFSEEYHNKKLSSLILHHACYEYFKKIYNNNKKFSINIDTFVDAPEGSGLGTSSSIVLAIISSLLMYFNKSLTKKKLIDLAYYIERDVCLIKGGVQDFYASLYGGVNLFNFTKNSTKIKKIKFSEKFQTQFDSSFMIAYLGQSRNSSKIIENQLKNMNDQSYLKNMSLTLKGVNDVYEAISNSDFKNFNQRIKQLWEIKKEFSPKISSNSINILINKLYELGALSVKISGAGGGGYFFLFCSLNNRQNIINFLKQKKITVENVYITNENLKTWCYG